MFEEYIKAGISPVMFEDVDLSQYKNAVVLDADCDISVLNGHYEGIDFVPPEWYENLINNSKNTYCLLVIKDINKIDKKEQLKFVEMFKYKKIGTFDLPKNTVIFVTCSNLQEGEIAQEIYSLLAHI